MPTLLKTFSVKNGLDVANTIVLDSNLNLSNIVTANVTTLNANAILANTINTQTVAFNTAYAGSVNVGQLSWDTAVSTLTVGLNANVSLHIGQDSLSWVRNDSGVALRLGQAVYISGAQGTRAAGAVRLAEANAEVSSEATIGLMADYVGVNGTGFMTQRGQLSGIDTGMYANGDVLYLSTTVPGGYSTVQPSAPNHLVRIGWVSRSHNTQGSIFVSVYNYPEFAELSDVGITAPANNDILAYNTAASYWENRSIATISQLAPWIDISANTTAVDGNKFLANTSGGTFTLTLPASPGVGNTVTVLDAANFALVPLRVSPNGKTVEGSTNNILIDVSGVQCTFIYDGNTWHVAASVGSAAPNGVTYHKTVTKTSNYTATAQDTVILANAAVMITLPAANTANNKMYTVKRISSAGPVTVNVAGGGFIDGNTQINIVAQYASMSVVSDNASYWII